MAYEQDAPFRFMSFNEFVPDKLRFWIYILFLLCFQFSNGMYFSAMDQMAGSLSFTPDDVKMMGNSVLVGLTMYFPLAFRLKFRFTNRFCLITAALMLILINIIVPFVNSQPLLMALCFVAGFFRLFGTFECFSSILPKITPTYNYAAFLSFVFFVVLGFIHVFDIAASYIMYYYNWRHMHFLAIGLLLLVILGVFALMRPFRPMPKMPLYGIDWLGMIVWSIFILSAIFVAQYGAQLNWFHSPYIRAAIGISFLALATNLLRILHIRHPFLEPAAFKTKNLFNLLLLFLFMDILLSTQQVLQNTFTSAVLRLDQLTSVNLYWFDVLGMLLGALFSWYSFTKLKWGHRLITFIGMSFIVLYITLMYSLITPYTNIEKLYLPLVCCGFGHVVVFIALTVYAQATAPFKNYFQVLCILGLIRTGIGAPLGDAIYMRAVDALFSIHISGMNVDINSIALQSSRISATANAEAMTAAVRELFGWSIPFGIFVLIIIAGSRFKKYVAGP